MAENETLDLGHVRNGRWQKWRDAFMAQSPSVTTIANEGIRCLAKTIQNIQRRQQGVSHE